ncbi:uncharacterized protein [Dysidea avara]|uniref:uncharacterized protein n=1 Tax=Dysidea avara TaxID=196820 RepID=UPI0033300C7B
MDNVHLLIFVQAFTLFMIVSSITVKPGDIIEGENCTGEVDDFLCNCSADSDAINIHLLPGYHVFNHYPCTITNKTSVVITGNSPDDTTIQCDGFSVVFMFTENVMMSNLTLVGCGGGMEDYVNNSLHSFVYLRQGSRFVFMLIDVVGVIFSDVTMRNTLGYGIIAFDAVGMVKLLGIHIENTLFDNDKNCIEYDYNSDKADFSCSGSGVMFVYRSIHNGNDSLVVTNSSFNNNANIVPLTLYNDFIDAINIDYFRNPIPLIGAGCITLYFTQTDFAVNVSITDTTFFNNTGSYSASVAITTVYSVLSRTRFENCTFENNNFNLTVVSTDYPDQNGGIKLLYLVLIGDKRLPNFSLLEPTESEMLTIVHCNFVKLGGAIYVQKLAANNLTISVKLCDCNFIDNQASTGAVFTAIERQFRTSVEYIITSAIRIFLSDVNVMNNDVYTITDFVTGVFVLYTVQVTVTCSKECKFWNNNPSVFFGRNSELTLQGKMSFKCNRATNGGALNILNTVVFIHTGAELQFSHNHAEISGGAINIEFTNTNVQTQDICPIQFIGAIEPIFILSELGNLNVSVSFYNNTVGNYGLLESIYSNVFYLCYWYTGTVVQIIRGLRRPIRNDARPAVYRSVLTFIPTDSAANHTYILADLPCLCDDSGVFNFTACATEPQIIKLNKTVVPGRPFNFSLVTLDIVGSVGYSRTLYSTAYENVIFGKELLLGDGQDERPFYLVNKTCTSVEFVIYGTDLDISDNGIIRLSLDRQTPNFLNVQFNIIACPIGFEKQLIIGNGYGCVCDTFFKKTDGRISCDTVTGKIIRVSNQAWLSAPKDGLEYARICLPAFCHNKLITFDLTEEDILCTNHHSGRVCGGCEDGFSRVFGSDTCKKCDDAWLATIILYAILGVVLVAILFLLKFTVTLGMINGLIFFCNAVSINERLFFNTQVSRFSFLRVFISLINLDLGFEICFYDGMSQLAKTGLQFVFPAYLWLLMIVIIFAHKRVIIQTNLHTVQVFATLLLLAYAKVLHALISVFAYVNVSSATHGSIVAWHLDPNVTYLTGGHIALFLIAFLFLILYIIPFAFGLTFPNRLMRSRKLSHYFFPLVDCFAAPYKDKCRFWLGIKSVLLIYLAVTEAVLFSSDEALLLSNIFVVGFFAFIQAFILPFKTLLSNVLDLLFMGIFLILCIVAQILYPSGTDLDIVVNILGYFSFVLFSFIVIYHVYDYRIKHTKVGKQLLYKLLSVKSNFFLMHKLSESVNNSHNQNSLSVIDKQDTEFSQLRESFLQYDN